MGTFSNRLRFAITNYVPGAFSYKSFAELVGIPYRTLQNYLSGERSPNIESLEKLAENGINVNWLITGRGSPYWSNGIDRDILDLVFTLHSIDILKDAFGDSAHLYEKRQQYKLLSFILGNNYLGLADVIYPIINDAEYPQSNEEMEADLASGAYAALANKVPGSKAELWKALQGLKQKRRADHSLPPLPLDKEVGQ